MRLAELAARAPADRRVVPSGNRHQDGPPGIGHSPAEISGRKGGADRQGRQYTEHDYQARLSELTKRGAEARLALKAAETRLHQHETQQAETLAKLGHDKVDAPLVEAITESFQLARRVGCEQVTMLNQRLGELEHFKHFVTCRYEMMSQTASSENLARVAHPTGRAAGTTFGHRATRWRFASTKSTSTREHCSNMPTTRRPAIRGSNRGSICRPNSCADPAGELRVGIGASEGPAPHARSFSGRVERRHPSPRRARHPLAALRQSLATAWDYQLANVGDDPITAGKIISGIFYLLIGLLLARVLSGLVGRSLLPRFGLNEGATHAIQAITFYSLCILFSFEILKLIHVPFASFTFLGGAVAIAVGFGCQNILNNFISGLILLAEQPIRVGDHVEIDGTRTAWSASAPRPGRPPFRITR